MGRPGIWQDGASSARSEKQKPGQGPGFPLNASRKPRYATLLNALFTPILSGSAVSVATL